MKDAYSFDVDDPAAMESYAQMYAAYERIFSRCGLATTAVEADTGAIGGNHSHEFMVMAEAGEDGIAVCESCGYSANLEKASSKIEPRNDPDDPAMPELVDTPNLSKIAEVSKFFDNPEHRCIKTMIYVTGIRKDDGSSDEKTIAVSVPGDREVNEIKLGKALKVDWVTLADEKTVIDVTGSKPGYAGPIGLDIPVYADERLRGIQGATAGPNVADKHYTHVNLERDASGSNSAPSTAKNSAPTTSTATASNTTWSWAATASACHARCKPRSNNAMTRTASSGRFPWRRSTCTSPCSTSPTRRSPAWSTNWSAALSPPASTC